MRFINNYSVTNIGGLLYKILVIKALGYEFIDCIEDRHCLNSSEIPRRPSLAAAV
jgi:hypothetical protein